MRRGRRIAQVLSKKHLDERPRERRSAGQRGVERRAHAVPIAGLGRRQTGAFLGRQIRGCSTDDGLMAAEAVRKELRDQTEVENDHASVRRHEHVGRLDVPMKLAETMERRDSDDQLLQGISEPSDRRACCRSLPDVVDEGDALHELHREEASGVFDKQLVEADDVWMRHSGEASKLLLQPIDAGWCGTTKGLERHHLVPRLIMNLVDHAHPAGAESSNHREAVGACKVVLKVRRPREPHRCPGYPTSLSGRCHAACSGGLTASEELLDKGPVLQEYGGEIGC